MLCSTAYYEIEKFDGGPWSVMQGRTCALAPKIPLIPTLQRYTDMRIKVAGPPSSSAHPQIASSDCGSVGQPKWTLASMFWDRACMIGPLIRRAGCTTARSAEGDIYLFGPPSIWLEPGANRLSTVSATR
tara:strand:+ start:2961 stop:3350 length:390 start_codon:yes stop_codon:yes gene_type:complete